MHQKYYKIIKNDSMHNFNGVLRTYLIFSKMHTKNMKCTPKVFYAHQNAHQFETKKNPGSRYLSTHCNVPKTV